MKTPIDGGILGRRYNRTLHGRSVYRKRDVPGHNVILGYLRPGVGDALDIFAPAGVPVFAMHSGRISHIADRGGRLSCLYVASRGIVTVYAHLHIHPRIAAGSRITEGQLIGWIGRMLNNPHLHLEIWTGGRAVASPSPSGLAEKINRLILDS